jgi:maleylpyruvate isomerase
MRLYGFSHSSSTWRVRIGLALKGIEVETVTVDVSPAAREQDAEGYERVNPARQVPALEWTEDGHTRTLSQSMAILQYLEQIHPTPPLWPEDAYARARATQLAELVNAGIQPLQNNRVLGRLEERGVNPDAWAKLHIERGLAALELMARDGTGRFLAGDAPMVPDLYAVPQLHNARKYGIDVTRFSTLARCEAACLELPAFSSTRPETTARHG